MELADVVAAQRHELADVLAGLPQQAWDAPSLCTGWRVREVVAHITMPFRYSTARFVRELIVSGGRCARRDARAPIAELLVGLRDNERHPWRPPGGGPVNALTHDVVHGLDITVPLGVGRPVPEDRVRLVLDTLAGARSRKHFGVDLADVRLVADDVDWSLGEGREIRMPAQDLVLLLSGRSVNPSAVR
jgi:uncharacterized protein (TIGR03083 family)